MDLGYHITHILLYAEPVLQDESYIPLIQEQAMQITNIAISDFPPPLMVFSTHGLFYGMSLVDLYLVFKRGWALLIHIRFSCETYSGHISEGSHLEHPQRC